METRRRRRPVERARWEELFAAHADDVFAYVARRIPLEDVADLVGETFVVAGRLADQVPDDALPWLYSVARNAMRNYRRSAERSEALHGRLSRVQLAPPDTTADLDEVESRQAVASALARLPASEREALLLVAWEDLDAERGSRVLGCSPAAFHVRVHRARRRVKRMLDEAGSLVVGDLQHGTGGSG